MAYNQQQSKSQSQPQRRSGAVNGALIGGIFLGVCILIAGLNIGGNLKKLNDTINEKSFSDMNSYNAPEGVTVEQKKYLTESEAAKYLNMNVQEITNLINSGEITEYVKTGTGYSISVTVLDSWFENEAYQNKLNAAGSAAPAE